MTTALRRISLNDKAVEVDASELRARSVVDRWVLPPLILLSAAMALTAFLPNLPVDWW